MFKLIESVYAQTPPRITTVATGLGISEFISRIISWFLYFGGALAVIYLMYGGFLYITAAGDEDKAKSGRTAIVNAIIGVVIIALALVLVQWTIGITGRNG